MTDPVLAVVPSLTGSLAPSCVPILPKLRDSALTILNLCYRFGRALPGEENHQRGVTCQAPCQENGVNCEEHALGLPYNPCVNLTPVGRPVAFASPTCSSHVSRPPPPGRFVLENSQLNHLTASKAQSHYPPIILWAAASAGLASGKARKAGSPSRRPTSPPAAFPASARPVGPPSSPRW